MCAHSANGVPPPNGLKYLLIFCSLLPNTSDLTSGLDRQNKGSMNKYIAEFIGTFFLILTIGCTGIGAGASVIAPLAIGAVLMVMVFAGGHISGAHYNPAVTVGMFIRGRLKIGDVLPYIICQVVAASLAALAVQFLRSGVVVTPIAPKLGPALLAEF